MKRNNNEYSYIQPQVDNKRKKKKRKKKKGGFGKVLLVIIAAGLLSVKYVFTDFYFSSVLQNKEVADFVDENIIGRTTTTTTTVPRETTTEATTPPQVSYLEHSDFEFEAAKKGAMIGNLLNGGKVDKDNGLSYRGRQRYLQVLARK